MPKARETQVLHYQLDGSGAEPAFNVCATREADMDAITQFAVLTLITIFAGILAFAMAWAFLRGAFRLMQPAAVRNSRTSAPRVSQQFHSDLVPGTRAAARQFALHR